MTTKLELVGIGINPYSARGLKQTLEPITQAAALRRTINGDLADLSLSGFRKYSSVITGSDVDPPVCDGVWPGRLVVVSCAAELSYVTAGGAASRPVVSGSVRVVGSNTYYRPQLTMRVVSFALDFEEYPHTYNWSLALEET